MRSKVLSVAFLSLICAFGTGLAGCAGKPDPASETTALKPTPLDAPKVDTAKMTQLRDFHRLPRAKYLKKYPASGGRTPR